MTSLSIENLKLAAGDRVLVQDVSLLLERGRVLGLVGASGGGKSLTVLAMLGLLPPGLRQVSGLLRHGGQVLDAGGTAALRGRTVGLVQQSPRACFNPILTVGRHFAETLERAAAPGRAADLLVEVGFEQPASLLRAYPFQLSGGMLQRVMLALALARDPDFLLADEPTTDLDLVAQAAMLDLLERLAARRGLGVLLVTHDLSVVARLAEAVAVMQNGRIVEQGPVRDFFQGPRHPASRALLRRHLALYGEALP